MRAATRKGMVFIGGSVNRGIQSTEDTKFVPTVIKPDPQVRLAREEFYQAMGRQVQQLRDLIANASCPQEAEYWEAKLARIIEDPLY